MGSGPGEGTPDPQLKGWDFLILPLEHVWQELMALVSGNAGQSQRICDWIQYILENTCNPLAHLLSHIHLLLARQF